MAVERGWAIKGTHGFYTGWWQTRADAIAGHVSSYEHVSQFVWGGHLSDAQRAAWAKLRKRGDRAVKIEISEVL